MAELFAQAGFNWLLFEGIFASLVHGVDYSDEYKHNMVSQTINAEIMLLVGRLYTDVFLNLLPGAVYSS